MAGDDNDKAVRKEPGDAPRAVLELAAACARFVQTRYGVGLDFDPDTLSLLDQWLRDARQEAAEQPEAIDLVQTAAGAYLGEVIRRQFGGTWFAEGDYADWRLQLEPVYCSFNPVGMAREAITLEAEDGWHAHFELDPGEAESVEARLAALPQVEEEDFYAPSTRYDIVCIVVDALREEMRSHGTGDVTFGPEDYGTQQRHINGKANGHGDGHGQA